MSFHQDLIDLFSELCAAEARFLVVGAHAVIHHTVPRYTKDMDVWVEPSRENAQRVFTALARFGAPLGGLSAAELERPGVIFQMGQPPARVDILTGIEALTFAACWERRVPTTFGGVPIYVLHIDDLIANKRAVARPQDLVDLDWLEKAKARQAK
jgi:hypothetical protein